MSDGNYDQSGVELSNLGADGVAFVRQRLSNVKATPGGLNSLLPELTVTDAFTFASPSEKPLPSNFSTSRGALARDAVNATRALIGEWLGSEPAPGARRFEVFEDRFSRRGDGGSEEADAFYFNDCPYF